MKNLHLIGIDWQQDFVLPTGALAVPGAEDDAKRLATLINRLSKKITHTHFSLDSHQVNQIFHPSWWVDKNNQHPNPFTPISAQEVTDGVWRATKKGCQAWSEEYTRTLEAQGRYGLFIWPYHCLLYTEGWMVYNKIGEALRSWELDNFKRVNFIVKGNNPWVENYSVFQAEVTRPEDPSTQLNPDIISTIQEADEIILTGEAGSHCLAWSVKDLANNFSDESYIKKLVLLTDTTSPVTGFEKQQEDFISEMTQKGMRTTTSADYLA
jgi:nicotinamidase/pyrazinamidase